MVRVMRIGSLLSPASVGLTTEQMNSDRGPRPFRLPPAVRKAPRNACPSAYIFP